MGYLADAFARKSAANYDILRQIAGWGRTSATGKIVSVKTALEVATVFACLRVRANGVAQVPLKLMRESKDGKTRLPAKDHPLYEILECRPNEWQTSFEYFEMLMFHLCLCGKAISFVNRSNRVGIMELIPFEPGSVTVKRADDWTLTYHVRGKNGSTQNFPAKAIWHLRGPSWDSWTGLEAVQLARESIGLAMAAEEQQARLQKNGVRASGVYSVDGTLPDDKYKVLRKWIDEEWGGPENAGKAMILDRSAKWLNTSMTGVDAQTQETRRFQVEEMCRQLGVNPIMVFAESKNTTYASAEQMFLAHVVHTVAPDYKRLEQSISANLLTEADRKDGLYPCFVDEGLLRGSMKDKKDTLLGYVNGGLMTPNEGRAKLDLNPDLDPESDKLRIPANIVGDVPPPDAKPAPSRAGAKPDEAVKSLIDLQDAAFKRIEEERKGFEARLERHTVEGRADMEKLIAAFAINQEKALRDALKEHDSKIDKALSAWYERMVQEATSVRAALNAMAAREPAAPATVTFEAGAFKFGDTTIATPELKAPEVHFHEGAVKVDAPVNVAPAEVKVDVHPDTRDTKTVYERDPKTKEVISSTTKRR